MMMNLLSATQNLRLYYYWTMCATMIVVLALKLMPYINNSLFPNYIAVEILIFEGKIGRMKNM